MNQCPECKGGLEYLESKTNPDANELYCAHCHKSYDVPREEVRTR